MLTNRNTYLHIAAAMAIVVAAVPVSHYTFKSPSHKTTNAVIQAWKNNPTPKAEQLDASEYSLVDLMSILEDSNHNDHLTSAAQEAISRMNDLDEIILGSDDLIYTIETESISIEALQQNVDNPIICNKNSPIFQALSTMTGPVKDQVQDGVDYLVIIPSGKIKNQDKAFTNMKDGTVYIENNGLVESYIPHVLGHESTHIADKNRYIDGILLIEIEDRALQKQLQIIDYQLSTSQDAQVLAELEVWREEVNGRIKVAEYLSQFPDFEGYYPGTMHISARDILYAGVSLATVQKYLEIDTDNEIFDNQLRSAAKAISIAYRETMEDADMQLLEMAQTGSEVDRVAVGGVLNYLHPNLRLKIGDELPLVETLQEDYQDMYRQSTWNRVLGRINESGFKIVPVVEADYEHTNRDSTILTLSLDPVDTN